jgi:hypothetical protein
MKQITNTHNRYDASLVQTFFHQLVQVQDASVALVLETPVSAQ